MKKQKKGFLFNSVQVSKPKYGRFDLSFRNTLTMPYGKLVPTLCKKVVSGDLFKLRSNSIIKSLPMLAPIMTEVDVYTDTFFVPMRIILGDSDFDKYINGEINLPSFDLSSISSQGLQKLGNPQHYFHYTGFPLIDHKPTPPEISSFRTLPPVTKIPILSIFKIWNDYYRDQFIEEEFNLDDLKLLDVDNFPSMLFAVKYPKDYFTSALPFAQAGEPISLPIGNTADVKFKLNDDFKAAFKANSDGDILAADPNYISGTVTNPLTYNGEPATLDNSGNLFVDLSTATSTTIAQLRTAYRMQEFMERRARGGGRAIEILLNNFGVQVPDYRMQRPEYLGGSRTPVNINNVVQTSGTSETSPQGTQTGNAVGLTTTYTRDGYFKVKEPGYIIQFQYVLARQSYFQGIQRDLFVTNYLDEYWPSFQHIGEQEIRLHEIWTPSNNQIQSPNRVDDLNETFGYTPRYAEYKFYPDEMHGDIITTLNFWQGSRAIGSKPALNSSFLSSHATDMDHNFAVGSEEFPNKWILAVYHDIDAIRPMDPYGTPLM